GAAGAARDRAAAHQPVPQPHEKFLARRGDRLSRPGRRVRRHNPEPDRAGDRDHRHHHGGLSRDLADHEPFDEHLQRARPAGGKMTDETANLTLARTQLLAEAKPPAEPGGVIGWARRNLFNSWFNALLTIVSLYLVWLLVPPLVKFLVIDA